MAEDEAYCSDCRKLTPQRLHAKDGTVVCTECGLVLVNSYIDPSSDVRIFEDNLGAKRTEDCDPLIGMMTTSIQVSTSVKDSVTTTTLKRREKQELRRDKNKIVKFGALEAIEEVGNRLTLAAAVIERAQFLYHQLTSDFNVSLRGKKNGAIVVGCLHFVAKEDGHGQSRSLVEMAASMPGLTKRDVSQAENFIRDTVIAHKLKLALPSAAESAVAGSDSPAVATSAAVCDVRAEQRVKEHVTRICNVLGFNFRDRRYAEELAERLQKIQVRRSPLSQAAAVVWIARKLTETEEEPTPGSFKRALLDHTHVAVGTLRLTYRDLYDHLPVLLPPRKSETVDELIARLQRP